MNFYELLKNYDTKLLVDKIVKIEDESLIDLRSTIVCELLKIRTKEILKYFKPYDKSIKIPEEYVNFFFGQLFVLKGDKYNIPLSYKRKAAEKLLDIETPFEYTESELSELYSKKGITDEDIFKQISHRIYDVDVLDLLDPYYIKNDEIIYKIEENKKLFYPFIILEKELEEDYSKILTYYYNLLENEYLEDSDKIYHRDLRDDDPPEANQRLLEYLKHTRPNVSLNNNKISNPILEEIMYLEFDCILHFKSYHNFI